MPFQKGRKIRHHILDKDFNNSAFNGINGKMLLEPVPNPLLLNGDNYIHGEVNNNARIVITRDRDPFNNAGKLKAQEEFDTERLRPKGLGSGYSSYMGAGAIDIVVGAGAPYPVFGPGSSDPSGGLDDFPSNLPPLYTTVRTPQLSGVTLGDGETKHPGILMDSARIYITQMGDVDKYFRITDFGYKADRGPSSAIVMKADRLRMHSRRDIKIVAGGDYDTGIDSCGYAIKERGSIHLIADNGAAGPQQFLVKGENLIECIKGIYDVLQDNLEILNNVVISQMQLNMAVAPSIRISGAGPSAWCPISVIANLFKTLADMKDLFNIWFNKYYNLPIAQEMTFVNTTGAKYILSRNNTTN